MRKKFSPWKNILFIAGALLIALLFVAVSNATTITIENCEMGTWVGGVKWIWKDGKRGNYVGSDYVDVPELELKNVGSKKVDLEPGDYAITHYQPRMAFRMADGMVMIIPAKILDFREITVTDKPATYYFGCE